MEILFFHIWHILMIVVVMGVSFTAGYLKENKMSDELTNFCNNCGHRCHCGHTCLREHTDGDNNLVQLNVVRNVV